MRQINHHQKQVTLLDNFIIVKKTTPVKKDIVPLQKDINLKDPTLKVKGIAKKQGAAALTPLPAKKNNITNKYEKGETKDPQKI
jgi:hypothetical protein